MESFLEKKLDDTSGGSSYEINGEVPEYIYEQFLKKCRENFL